MTIQSITNSIGNTGLVIIETIFIYTIVMIVMYFFYVRFWDGFFSCVKKIKKAWRKR